MSILHSIGCELGIVKKRRRGKTKKKEKSARARARRRTPPRKKNGQFKKR